MTASTSHYNESQDHCYVRVDVVSEQGNTQLGVPVTSYTIYDAFDANTSASCSDDPNTKPIFCSVDEPGKPTVNDCGHCRSRIAELMTQ